MQTIAVVFLTSWVVFRILMRIMSQIDYPAASIENGEKGKKLPSTENGKTKQSSSNNIISSLCRRMAGSNWENAPESKQNDAGQESKVANKKKKKDRQQRQPEPKWSKFVAMDCEMVGIGPDGRNDMLARVSIVSQDGEVLMDKYVKAQDKVVDYRTRVSGIRPHNMENGEEFTKVQQEVRQMLHHKVLVGHSVKNDLAVLNLKHPYWHIRDTAKYRPLAKLVSNGATPSLKRLAKAILGLDIQDGEHSSVEDARACMLVYVRCSKEWERHIAKLQYRRRHGRHRS